VQVVVIGTGYVGLTAAACLAHLGHTVFGVDDDAQKIQALSAGRVPLYEPHLGELVQEGRGNGRLRFLSSLADALTGAEVALICVGTPIGAKGEADLSAVEKVARRLAEAATGPLLVVEKSTVPAQTGQWIARTLATTSKGAGVDLEVASNPEFQREGSAVSDFLHPDRLVFGVSSAQGEAQLRALYAPILERRINCPVHAQACPGAAPPVIVTDITTAELIKHAANSFLATKISFINLIADLCERLGADASAVAEGVGTDPRIGRANLQAGLGFGGSCFPKDLQAFVALAQQAGVDFNLLEEVSRINARRIDRAVEKLRQELWVLKDKEIALLGLAFKPETDDVRNAPALALAERLKAEGAVVRGYDPQAGPRAASATRAIAVVSDAYRVAENADALVLCTEWPDFAALDWSRIHKTMRRPLVLDGRNFIDRAKLEAFGFRVLRMGA